MSAAVSTNYVHGNKLVSPGRVLELPGRRLKWYGISTAKLPVPDAIDAMARDFLAKADLEGVGPLGFVVLHRCGPARICRRSACGRWAPSRMRARLGAASSCRNATRPP